MNVRIFPINVLGSESDRLLREEIQRHCDENLEQNLAFMQEAATDSLLEAGDQAALNSLGFRRILPNLDMYTFNKGRRITSFVSGMQRQERKSIKVTPQEYGDQHTADQYTKLLFNINNQNSVLETVSDAFQSSLITGLTLLQVWMDYRTDPLSGDLKIKMCPYNSFIIAPFNEVDLSDCSAIFKRTYITKKECLTLLPEYKEDIESIVASASGPDELFPHLSTDIWGSNSHLAYDEFYYRDTRDARTIVNKITGETIEYCGQDDDRLKEILKQPEMELKVVPIPTVRLAILVNGYVFHDILNPLGDDYPFVPVFAYHSKTITTMSLKYQSLIRGMRDSQFLYNLITSLEVEYLQTRINPIIKFKPSSLINPKAVSRRGLSNEIGFKRNVSLADMEITPPMDIPSSLPLIREQVGKEIIQNDIGNEEMLGTSSDDIAGVQEALRHKSGSTVLEPIFDSLDRSLRILGQRQIRALQLNYTPGKVTRILQEQPADEFYNKAFAKFDCVVEDGVNTSTQRQLQFSTMLAMHRMTPEMIPAPMLLKASTIQNKQEIIDYIEKIAQQEQESAQQEKEVQQRLQQAEAELASSTAEKNRASAAQSYAKIEDNKTQAIANLAEANKDDERATLDKIKAAKELDSIDFDNLSKLIALVNAVKSQELQQAGQKITGNTSMGVDNVKPTIAGK